MTNIAANSFNTSRAHEEPYKPKLVGHATYVREEMKSGAVKVFGPESELVKAMNAKLALPVDSEPTEIIQTCVPKKDLPIPLPKGSYMDKFGAGKVPSYWKRTEDEAVRSAPSKTIATPTYADAINAAVKDLEPAPF